MRPRQHHHHLRHFCLLVLLIPIPAGADADAQPIEDNEVRKNRPKLLTTDGGEAASEEIIRKIEGDQAHPMTQAITELKKLGTWDNQAGMARSIIDQLFEQNGWDSEADQFARQLSTDVATVPPWDFRGRVSALTGGLAKRYDLTFSQKLRLQTMVLKEVPLFVMEHSDLLLRQTSQYVQGQLAGEGFSSEQIAEWIAESDDLYEDFDARVRRMIDEFDEHLSDTQRDILHQDLDAYVKRQHRVAQLRDKWRQGKWKPGEWGLTAEEETAARLAELAGEDVQQRVQPCDETTWSVYTRDAIKRYDMEDSQKETALSILQEMSERAQSYRASQKSRQESGPVVEREAPSMTDITPICGMFEELLIRTERIPREAQRRQSEPGNNAPGPAPAE